MHSFLVDILQTAVIDFVVWASGVPILQAFMLGAGPRVKVALRHTYVALRMRSVVQHLYDGWAVHIRRKSMHGRSELLVA